MFNEVLFFIASVLQSSGNKRKGDLNFYNVYNERAFAITKRELIAYLEYGIIDWRHLPFTRVF